MLTVVKLGGRAVEEPSALKELALRVAELPGRSVVVHGGGAEITAWQERLGLGVVKHNGLRVTTLEGLKLTAMVLSGWVNKRVVGALLEAGLDAIGVSGEDGGLLTAERKDGGALGEVGTVRSVRAELLERLLALGLTPVLSPLSRGPEGMPLNVNADEAAVAVARALGAGRLFLISDVPGLLVNGRALAQLTPEEGWRLIETGVAVEGMRVKLGGAIQAAEQGIEVRIGDATVLSDPGAGTRLALVPGVGGVV
ncbi:MAG: acetylglutamate kinase [Gemmatimonadetes bacterium]|nr:acetylglutamate kinase [Gemmatimonadota bacterium]